MYFPNSTAEDVHWHTSRVFKEPGSWLGLSLNQQSPVYLHLEFVLLKYSTYTIYLLLLATGYSNSSCAILPYILIAQLLCLGQSTKMDDTPVNIIPQAWCFIWRCERLEQILISMKEITTSFIPQQRLHVLRIDLNHLDIATGITSPSVTRYFMPRTNTPRIEKIREDPSWDWFLSQRGSFGKGTYRANHLLRRVFMDYQDSSIPEFWPRELHEAESEEKENNQDSTAQESSGQLDNTGGDRENNEDDKTHDKEVNKGEEINSDKAKEGEIIGPKKTDESDEDGDKIEESGGDNCNPSDESQNKNEKRDKEADVDHEMVISKALDRDIRNYRTNDWSVYW